MTRRSTHEDTSMDMIKKHIANMEGINALGIENSKRWLDANVKTSFTIASKVVGFDLKEMTERTKDLENGSQTG